MGDGEGVVAHQADRAHQESRDQQAEHHGEQQGEAGEHGGDDGGPVGRGRLVGQPGLDPVEQAGGELVVEPQRCLALEVGGADAEEAGVAGVVLPQQVDLLVVGQQQLEVGDGGGLDTEEAVELLLRDHRGVDHDQLLLAHDREAAGVEVADDADERLGAGPGVGHAGDAEGDLALEVLQLLGGGRHDVVGRPVAQALGVLEQLAHLGTLPVGEVGARPGGLERGGGLVDPRERGLALLLVVGLAEDERGVLGRVEVGDGGTEDGHLAGGRVGRAGHLELVLHAQPTEHDGEKQRDREHERDLAHDRPLGDAQGPPRVLLRLGPVGVECLGHGASSSVRGAEQRHVGSGGTAGAPFGQTREAAQSRHRNRQIGPHGAVGGGP